MKVTTDACLFGAWCAQEIQRLSDLTGGILDIGAGSGLLSLMLAQKSPMTIDGIEIDKAAAEQARENMVASPWKDRITIENTDVLNWEPRKRYNYIVSNPPFYEKELKSANKLKNIAHHDEGLKLRILLAIIKKHLADNGQFFLLLPAKREAELAYLLKEFNFDLIQKVFVRQTVHHQPFRILVQAGQNQNTVSQLSEIVIKEKDNHYSAAFISLLKDYYLYL